MVLSREAAIAIVEERHNVAAVQRREAKLMAWKDFANATGCRYTGASDEQTIWVVGIHGSMSTPQGAAAGGAIAIDAATGRGIAGDVSMVPKWPDYWDMLPDSAKDTPAGSEGGLPGLTS